MHMRTIRPEGLTPLALSITLALSLAACGGSGDEEPALVFQPGEVVTFAATLEDGSTQEDRYLVHGVTAEGDLLTDVAPTSVKTAKMSGGPHKRPPLALVALPLENGEQADAPRLAALRDFYKQLWQGIAERRNDGSDIAAEIGAFENDVGALYDDYQRSEFVRVKDYVAFYEQVGENPYFDAQESVEEELVFFFYLTGWRQGVWLQALQRQNLDWPRFLQLMAERHNTFADLLGKYQTWSQAGGIGMEAFIARYAAGSDFYPEAPGIARSGLKQAGISEASGAEKFFATNKSWGVRINSREQSSVAIVSSQDTNISHYHRVGEKKDICPTKLTISGRLGVAQAELEWKMKYTEEKHASLPGTFISSFGMEYFSAHGGERIVEVYDELGRPSKTSIGGVMSPALVKSLSVNLEIKDLKNIGTETAPRPGFTARVKVTPSVIFNSPWVRTCEVR
ncbi:hypothetical protein [Simplicispira metamorpha]|uniref:Lipoprotein n=1 Tax=Simplicispira metamorpha TaxID=80881 RepID=A0A4R2NEC7_9BURK|nr:hypothetical protein [Simplicispira metamorpha]TCP19474.1 hypothetical protein EV674_105152 [Simplicispira metamorpha]